MAQYVANTIEVIERYLNEHHFVDVHDGEYIVRSFLDNASSFTQFLIHSNFIIAGLNKDLYKDNELVIQIVEAAHKAEDAVEHLIMRNLHHHDFAAITDDVIHVLDVVAERLESIKQDILHKGKAADLPRLKWAGDQSPEHLIPPPSTLNNIIVDSSPAAANAMIMNKKRQQIRMKVNHFVHTVAAKFVSIKQTLPPSNNIMFIQNKKNQKKRKVHDFAPIYEDDLEILKARILHPTKKLQIIPIIGPILGMGKRTLTLRLYNDSSVVDHFHIRACISAFLEEDVKVILLNLLEGLGYVVTKETRRQSVDEVGLILTNYLKYYSKYFIIIHNIENADIWSKLRRFFPEDRSRSRILFTVFLDEDEKASEYGKEVHMMRYLRESESWLLFCHLVFQLDHCPFHELQPIAKVILGYCKGVAQTVSLIAGLLATSEINPTFWKLVAQTLKIQLEGEENKFGVMKIVFVLIYNHLPYYLKPCLLYIIAFRECRDIKASDIIQLWIAEGLLKKSAHNSFNDIARPYLDILIDKNLLHLSRQGPTGKVEDFHIQPVLRAHCAGVAYVENFVWSKDFQTADWSPVDKDLKIDSIRRVSGHQLLQPSDEDELSPLARSFISTGYASPTPTHVFAEMRLLRILAVFQLELRQFPQEILDMFLLRYLSFSCHSNTPASITKLKKNLQTLIIRRIPWFRSFALPIELLEMEQLTHFKCKETFVWRHPTSGRKIRNGKLQTLSNLQLFGLNIEFFEQIPSIRKLGIFCNIGMHYVLDLSWLDKLEVLKCSTDWSLASKNFLSNIKFPSLLRKLTLTKCRIPSGFMKVVGELSGLKELKLLEGDFLVPEWEPAEGEFPRLISLVMKDLNLVHWKAHASHFPRLQQLIILSCYAMLGLPEDIGDIQTLELIHVNRHSPSVVASAMKIKEKHCGHPVLEVKITKS